MHPKSNAEADKGSVALKFRLLKAVELLLVRTTSPQESNILKQLNLYLSIQFALSQVEISFM